MKRISSLLLVLMLVPAVHAVVLDMGSYSVENPLITVIYTTDVSLVSARLTSLEPGVGEYELAISPSSGYDDTHLLRTELNGTEHPLVPGEYELSLTAVDPQGDSTVDVVHFEVTGPAIRLLEPPFGIATSHPYNVIFMTLDGFEPVNATCQWSKLGFETGLSNVDSSKDGTHQIYNLDYKGFLYITCVEESGRETAKRFTVGWDESAPEIEASATPPLIRDPRDKSTFVLILADEDVVCQMDEEYLPGHDPLDETTYDTRHETRRYYNEIVDDGEHKFHHKVECTNLAGLTTTAILDVTVNLGLFAYIDVTHPPQHTNESSFTMVAWPTFTADACSVNGEQMTPEGETFEAFFSNLPEGEQAFDLYCTGSEEAEREYTVTIDSTAPDMQDVVVQATSCENVIEFSYEAVDESDVSSYTWTVFDETEEETEIVEEKETIAKKGETALPAGLYTLSVYATDKAGNVGLPLTAAFEILLPEDPACEEGAIPGPETCALDADCPIGQVCTSGICVNAGTTPAPCVVDADCAIGEACTNGICIDPGSVPDPEVKSEPTPGCTSDIECSIDEECRAGVCLPRSTRPTQTPIGQEPSETEGLPWLALILIIMGVLIMGGSGYYLYEQHENKSGGMPGGKSPKGPPPSTPQQRSIQEQQAQQKARETMLREQQAQKQKQQVSKQKREEREQERHEKFKKFEKKPKKGKEDDVFDKLEKLGKK